MTTSTSQVLSNLIFSGAVMSNFYQGPGNLLTAPSTSQRLLGNIGSASLTGTFSSAQLSFDFTNQLVGIGTAASTYYLRTLDKKVSIESTAPSAVLTTLTDTVSCTGTGVAASTVKGVCVKLADTLFTPSQVCGYAFRTIGTSGAVGARLSIGTDVAAASTEVYPTTVVDDVVTMRDGRVGINDSSPAQAVSVGGDVRLSGTIKDASYTYGLPTSTGTFLPANGYTGITGTFTNGNLSANFSTANVACSGTTGAQSFQLDGTDKSLLSTDGYVALHGTCIADVSTSAADARGVYVGATGKTSGFVRGYAIELVNDGVATTDGTVRIAARTTDTGTSTYGDGDIYGYPTQMSTSVTLTKTAIGIGVAAPASTVDMIGDIHTTGTLNGMTVPTDGVLRMTKPIATSSGHIIHPGMPCEGAVEYRRTNVNAIATEPVSYMAISGCDQLSRVAAVSPRRFIVASAISGSVNKLLLVDRTTLSGTFSATSSYLTSTNSTNASDIDVMLLSEQRVAIVWRDSENERRISYGTITDSTITELSTTEFDDQSGAYGIPHFALIQRKTASVPATCLLMWNTINDSTQHSTTYCTVTFYDNTYTLGATHWVDPFGVNESFMMGPLIAMPSAPAWPSTPASTFVFCMSQQNGSYPGKYATFAATLSAGSLTIGSPTWLATPGDATLTRLTPIDETRFCEMYTNGTNVVGVVIGTITGTSIAWGTPLVLATVDCTRLLSVRAIGARETLVAMWGKATAPTTIRYAYLTVTGAVCSVSRGATTSLSATSTLYNLDCVVTNELGETIFAYTDATAQLSLLDTPHFSSYDKYQLDPLVCTTNSTLADSQVRMVTDGTAIITCGMTSTIPVAIPMWVEGSVMCYATPTLTGTVPSIASYGNDVFIMTTNASWHTLQLTSTTLALVRTDAHSVSNVVATSTVRLGDWIAMSCMGTTTDLAARLINTTTAYVTRTLGTAGTRAIQNFTGSKLCSAETCGIVAAMWIGTTATTILASVVSWDNATFAVTVGAQSIILTEASATTDLAICKCGEDIALIHGHADGVILSVCYYDGTLHATDVLTVSTAVPANVAVDVCETGTQRLAILWSDASDLRCQSVACDRTHSTAGPSIVVRAAASGGITASSHGDVVIATVPNSVYTVHVADGIVGISDLSGNIRSMGDIVALDNLPTTQLSVDETGAIVQANTTIGSASANVGQIWQQAPKSAPPPSTSTESAIVDDAVYRTTTQTLTNKTLTTPVISSIVNSGTLELPTVTQALIGNVGSSAMTGILSNAAGTLSCSFTAGKLAVGRVIDATYAATALSALFEDATTTCSIKVSNADQCIMETGALPATVKGISIKLEDTLFTAANTCGYVFRVSGTTGAVGATFTICRDAAHTSSEYYPDASRISTVITITNTGMGINATPTAPLTTTGVIRASGFMLDALTSNAIRESALASRTPTVPAGVIATSASNVAVAAGHVINGGVAVEATTAGLVEMVRTAPSGVIEYMVPMPGLTVPQTVRLSDTMAITSSYRSTDTRTVLQTITNGQQLYELATTSVCAADARSNICVLTPTACVITWTSVAATTAAWEYVTIGVNGVMTSVANGTIAAALYCPPCAVRLDNTHGLLFISYTSGTNNIDIMPFTASGTLTFGTTQTLTTFLGVTKASIYGACSFSATTIGAVVYNETSMFAAIATVDGSGVCTWGGLTDPGTALAAYDIIALTATSFALAFRVGTLSVCARCGSISGTTITWGSLLTIMSIPSARYVRTVPVSATEFLTFGLDNNYSLFYAMVDVAGTTATRHPTMYDDSYGAAYETATWASATWLARRQFVFGIIDYNTTSAVSRIVELPDTIGGICPVTFGTATGSIMSVVWVRNNYYVMSRWYSTINYVSGVMIANGHARILNTLSYNSIGRSGGTVQVAPGYFITPARASSGYPVADYSKMESDGTMALIASVTVTMYNASAVQHRAVALSDWRAVCTAVRLTTGNIGAFVLTCTPTTITAGALQESKPSGAGTIVNVMCVTRLTATTYFVAYMDTNVAGAIATVSGDTITYGSPVTIISGVTSERIDACALTSASLLLGYENGTDTYVQYATISSGTISLGTALLASGGRGKSISMITLDASHAFIVYNIYTTAFINVMKIIAGATSVIDYSGSMYYAVRGGGSPADRISAVLAPNGDIVINGLGLPVSVNHINVVKQRGTMAVGASRYFTSPFAMTPSLALVAVATAATSGAVTIYSYRVNGDEFTLLSSLAMPYGIFTYPKITFAKLAHNKVAVSYRSLLDADGQWTCFYLKVSAVGVLTVVTYLSSTVAGSYEGCPIFTVPSTYGTATPTAVMVYSPGTYNVNITIYTFTETSMTVVTKTPTVVFNTYINNDAVWLSTDKFLWAGYDRALTREAVAVFDYSGANITFGATTPFPHTDTTTKSSDIARLTDTTCMASYAATTTYLAYVVYGTISGLTLTWTHEIPVARPRSAGFTQIIGLNETRCVVAFSTTAGSYWVVMGIVDVVGGLLQLTAIYDHPLTSYVTNSTVLISPLNEYGDCILASSNYGTGHYVQKICVNRSTTAVRPIAASGATTAFDSLRVSTVGTPAISGGGVFVPVYDGTMSQVVCGNERILLTATAYASVSTCADGVFAIDTTNYYVIKNMRISLTIAHGLTFTTSRCVEMEYGMIAMVAISGSDIIVRVVHPTATTVITDATSTVVGASAEDVRIINVGIRIFAIFYKVATHINAVLCTYTAGTITIGTPTVEIDSTVNVVAMDVVGAAMPGGGAAYLMTRVGAAGATLCLGSYDGALHTCQNWRTMSVSPCTLTQLCPHAATTTASAAQSASYIAFYGNASNSFARHVVPVACGAMMGSEYTAPAVALGVAPGDTSGVADLIGETYAQPIGLADRYVGIATTTSSPASLTPVIATPGDTYYEYASAGSNYSIDTSGLPMTCGGIMNIGKAITNNAIELCKTDVQTEISMASAIPTYRNTIAIDEVATLSGKTITGAVVASMFAGAALMTVPSTSCTLALAASATAWTNKTFTSPVINQSTYSSCTFTSPTFQSPILGTYAYPHDTPSDTYTFRSQQQVTVATGTAVVAGDALCVGPSGGVQAVASVATVTAGTAITTGLASQRGFSVCRLSNRVYVVFAQGTAASSLNLVTVDGSTVTIQHAVAITDVIASTKLEGQVICISPLQILLTYTDTSSRIKIVPYYVTAPTLVAASSSYTSAFTVSTSARIAVVIPQTAGVTNCLMVRADSTNLYSYAVSVTWQSQATCVIAVAAAQTNAALDAKSVFQVVTITPTTVVVAYERTADAYQPIVVGTVDGALTVTYGVRINPIANPTAVRMARISTTTIAVVYSSGAGTAINWGAISGTTVTWATPVAISGSRFSISAIAPTTVSVVYANGTSTYYGAYTVTATTLVLADGMTGYVAPTITIGTNTSTDGVVCQVPGTAGDSLLIYETAAGLCAMQYMGLAKKGTYNIARYVSAVTVAATGYARSHYLAENVRRGQALVCIASGVTTTLYVVRRSGALLLASNVVTPCTDSLRYSLANFGNGNIMVGLAGYLCGVKVGIDGALGCQATAVAGVVNYVLGGSTELVMSSGVAIPVNHLFVIDVDGSNIGHVRDYVWGDAGLTANTASAGTDLTGYNPTETVQLSPRKFVLVSYTAAAAAAFHVITTTGSGSGSTVSAATAGPAIFSAASDCFISAFAFAPDVLILTYVSATAIMASAWNVSTTVPTIIGSAATIEATLGTPTYPHVCSKKLLDGKRFICAMSGTTDATTRCRVCSVDVTTDRSAVRFGVGPAVTLVGQGDSLAVAPIDDEYFAIAQSLSTRVSMGGACSPLPNGALGFAMEDSEAYVTLTQRPSKLCQLASTSRWFVTGSRLSTSGDKFVNAS